MFDQKSHIHASTKARKCTCINQEMIEKHIILAGAGVSVDSPSNFPMAIPIINAIINAITLSDEIKKDLLKKDIREEVEQRLKLSGDFLRFEMLIDAVSLVDKKLKVLDIIKNYKNPNLNHYNLAKLAIDGNYVFTPNFDDLIERAIYDLGYTPQTICSKDDYETFSFRNKKTIPVFKLHGSYHSYIGEGNKKKLTKDTIQASLTSIISDNKSLLLAPYKINILKKCLKKTGNMLFVGYSGSDDFDIVPSLMELNISNIIWINHSEKICLENVIENYLADNSGRSSLLRKQHKKAEDTAKIYNTNTRVFLSDFGGIKKIQSEKNIYTSISFDEYFKKWSDLLTDDKKLYILGKVYQGLDFYDKAAKLFSMIPQESKCYIDSQLQLCFCLDQRSNYKEALSLIKSLKEYKNINKTKKYLEILSGEAYYKYRLLGNEIGLEEVFKKVLQKAGKRYALLQNAMNGYALFLRDLSRTVEASVLFRRSYQLSVKQGDLQRQNWVACNMANLLYDKGNIKDAEVWAQIGIKQAEMLGDHRQVGVYENLFANISFIKGKYDEAINYCEKSINRDKYIGNEVDSSVNELLLGQCFFDKDDYESAFSHYKKSLDLFYQSDDRCYLYELLFYILVYNIKIHGFKEAEQNLHLLSGNVNHTGNGVDLLYYKIADKIVDYFVLDNKRSFKDDLCLFIEDMANQEIIAYINIIWYLVILGIPACLIGEQHIVNASKRYFSYGNLIKYKRLNLYNKMS